MRTITPFVVRVGLALSRWLAAVRLGGVPCVAGGDHVLYNKCGSCQECGSGFLESHSGRVAYSYLIK